MPYKSNARTAVALLRRGIDGGLNAIAKHATDGIRLQLLRQAGGRPGYTTGNFSHGIRGVAGRVMSTVPFDRGSARCVAIGTSTTAGFPYELAWELGHVNLYTRRYERVEVWAPFLARNATLYAAMMARNIQRVTGGSTAVTTITTAFRRAA